MTAATLTIATFLLARIAEDEAAAKTARDTEAGYIQFGYNAAEALLGLAESEGTDDEGLAHFGRWMPARVLAECEAKRRIVQLESRVRRREDAPEHDREWFDGDHYVVIGGRRLRGDEALAFLDEWYEPAPPSQVVRVLAAVYADHPDFQEEWRP